MDFRIFTDDVGTTLNLEDVAWLLSTDCRTVRRWADAGILKSYQDRNGKMLFRRKDIARLIDRLEELPVVLRSVTITQSNVLN